MFMRMYVKARRQPQEGVQVAPTLCFAALGTHLVGSAGQQTPGAHPSPPSWHWPYKPEPLCSAPLFKCLED